MIERVAAYPWQTVEARWAALRSLLESDWHEDGPGALLVEALEALVDEWHGVVDTELVAAIEGSDRLRETVLSCHFAAPQPIVDALLRAAGEPL